VASRSKVFWTLIVVAAAAMAFIWVQVDIATKSIQFDLRKIGESVYEAHARTDRWPRQIADLEGTEYLRMPHRRAMLEQGLFVVVWQQDLDPNPARNSQRILAYDDGSLLSRLGGIWVCRGDLRVDRADAAEISALHARR
jgi:hypothetical protein